MIHEERLIAAANHYGLARQLDKTLEELEELAQAIREGRWDGPGGITEEAADVLNMVAQVAYLAGMEEEVFKIAKEKMIRTIRRIEEEGKGIC